MGGTTFNDLTAWSYWAFVATAVVILALAARTLWYKIALAALNLGFCALLAGWQAAAILAILLLYLHGSCQTGGRLRVAVLAVAGTLVGAAFLVHKLATTTHGAIVGPALASIGFSYLFLRAVEYLRAGASGNTAGISLCETINYLVPFHMLIAGPVAAFNDFKRHPAPAAALSRDEALAAIERIARGLFKKFVLASGLVETVFLTDFRTGGLYFLIEVQMYYLFIYLDFSAYTDIAVGIGRLLGVATPENFNKPLGARNIIVFWERWHMSLSQFIRRNLFIPIQLTAMRWNRGRHPRLITAAAFIVSFVSCGLWHGLTWRFLLWGMGHAVALILCSLYRDWLTARLGRTRAAAFCERPLIRVAATVLTFEFVAFSLAFLADPALAFLG